MQSSLLSEFKRVAVWVRRFRFLLLIPVMSASLSAPPSACAASSRIDLSSMHRGEALKVLATQNHVCGVAIAVIRNRKLDSVDAASGCPPNSDLPPDSIFQAASLSKPVFAYAVLKLIEQGKLELDAPVMKYFPQGYRHQFNPSKPEPSDMVTDPRIRTLTVRMLLNHTSGLPNWASGPLSFDANPGTKWSYSGEGYMLLQRAVEAVSGEPLDRFMASQVFAPLAMENSSFVRNEKKPRKNYCRGRKRMAFPGRKWNSASRSRLLPSPPPHLTMENFSLPC